MNLSCGHVLCKECALALHPRQCPTCRKRFNAKTLKINYTFKSLIEQVKINETKMEEEEERRRKEKEEEEKRKREEEKRKKEMEEKRRIEEEKEKRRIEEEKKKCYDILMNAYGKDRTKAESVMKRMKEKDVGVDLDETKFKSLFDQFKAKEEEEKKKKEEEERRKKKATSKGRIKQTARKSTGPRLVRAKPLVKEDEIIDLCDSDEDESDTNDSAVPEVVDDDDDDDDVIDLVSPARKKRKKENLETFLSEQSDVIKCPRFSCNYRFIDEEIKHMKKIQIPFKCPKCNGEFCLNCRGYLRACKCKDPTTGITSSDLNSMVMKIVQNRLRL